jgi:hypothetical protein
MKMYKGHAYSSCPKFQLRVLTCFPNDDEHKRLTRWGCKNIRTARSRRMFLFVPHGTHIGPFVPKHCVFTSCLFVCDFRDSEMPLFDILMPLNARASLTIARNLPRLFAAHSASPYGCRKATAQQTSHIRIEKVLAATLDCFKTRQDILLQGLTLFIS